MRRLAIVFSALVLAACASTPALITGNGTCQPSQDLPAEKVIQKLPEQATLFEEFYHLFARERKDHAKDVEDYNSLYSQCVTK